MRIEAAQGSLDRAVDEVLRRDLVALFRLDLGDVGVERIVLVPVVHDDQVPVPLEPSGVHDVARVHRRDVATHRCLDVDAIPESPRPESRVYLRPESRHDPPLGRPRQPAAKAPEPGRRRLDPTLGWRRLRQLALLGLEVANERLETLRGFRQFPDDALVVGSLVAHPREERPTLRGVAIDFRLLPLALLVEARQLPLLRLLAALAVRQSLRRTTILLNQSGV